MQILLGLIAVLVGEYLRIEREKKIRSEKMRNLSKIKNEINIQRKKEQFEQFKSYIENKYKDDKEYKLPGNTSDEKIMNLSRKRKRSNIVCLEAGVKRLRDNGHKYVPYERANPLDDIRSSLGEFTVSDVIDTFYFLN